MNSLTIKQQRLPPSTQTPRSSCSRRWQKPIVKAARWSFFFWGVSKQQTPVQPGAFRFMKNNDSANGGGGPAAAKQPLFNPLSQIPHCQHSDTHKICILQPCDVSHVCFFRPILRGRRRTLPHSLRRSICCTNPMSRRPPGPTKQQNARRPPLKKLSFRFLERQEAVADVRRYRAET